MYKRQSVECADRGLDSFTTNLVVADPDRSANTICLAITPAMKALGARNRCRVRDIPESIDYMVAVPRMRRYMEASGQIVAAYLELVSAEDVHVYSIDECFIDAAPYLRLYRTDARTFARKLMDAAFRVTGVTATAGIGENMFQAKVALDICAKHAPDGIGQLDAESFKREVWFHRPITDVWGRALRGVWRSTAHTTWPAYALPIPRCCTANSAKTPNISSITLGAWRHARCRRRARIARAGIRSQMGRCSCAAMLRPKPKRCCEKWCCPRR